MKKKELTTKIIEAQKKLISKIENSILEYKNAIDIDKNDTIDPEDFSHLDEAKEMQLLYNQKLLLAKKDLENVILNSKNILKSIENGAIVETENLFIYIGISLPIFEYENKKVISISENAPLFENIKNKKISQKIKIGNTEETILEIY